MFQKEDIDSCGEGQCSPVSDGPAPFPAEAVTPPSNNAARDPLDPVNWTKGRKWLVTGFSCLMTFMMGINALSISSAATAINKGFNVSDENFPNSYWTITAWNVGAVVGPLIGLPLMENFGLRKIYLGSLLLFVIFVIPQALANSYATLIVTRFIAASFGSVVQNAVANVIGDIWVGEEITFPATLFSYSYLFGFTLSPALGSAIAQYLPWRWIFYIELMMYGPFLPLAWFLVRETRVCAILAKAAKKQVGSSERILEDLPPEETFFQLLYNGTVRPAYLFFTEPVVFFFSLWSGLAVGNVFLATQSIGQTFGKNYGFNDVQAGYVESAMAVGETIGLLICYVQGRIYHASAKKNKVNPGQPIPEYRLTLSIPASFLGFGGGLMLYAWTSYPGIPWIVPTFALGLLGVAIMVVVQAAVIYIQDAYGSYAGSAVAAVASVENLISAFLPLSSQSLYTKLGFQWASSLLAFFALALSFAPVVLYLKGPSIRARSKFMQTT